PRRHSVQRTATPDTSPLSLHDALPILRQGEARAAADHFLGATRSNAGDAEAWYGLGLARVRLGQRTEAAEAWRRTLRLAPGYEEDRKSTRLNSSHLGISYAVFCLKKKK